MPSPGASGGRMTFELVGGSDFDPGGGRGRWLLCDVLFK